MMDLKNTRSVQLTALLLLCSLALASTARAQTATSTPQTATSTVTVTTLTVTTLTDDANTPGSLPYLLNQANAKSWSATSTRQTAIIFDAALSGGTITPTRPLKLSDNIHLLAQDADGMSIDMTLDGSQLPAGDDLLTITSRNTATVQGFDIVNFTNAGIHVSNFHDTCPANARVTLSDNVLMMVATSTAVGIKVRSGFTQCSPAVSIIENRIAADTSEPETPRGTGIRIGSRPVTVSGNTLTGTGIHIQGDDLYWLGDRISRLASREGIAATVSGNTITNAHENGISILGGKQAYDQKIAATVSGNTITNASDTGILIVGSHGQGERQEVTVTVSGNTITGSQRQGIALMAARNWGKHTKMDATVSNNFVTGSQDSAILLSTGWTRSSYNRGKFRGSGNTFIGSGIADIFAVTTKYGPNYLNGRFENTIYNTADLVDLNPKWPYNDELIINRYQATTLPDGGITGGYQNHNATGTVTAIEETYLSAPTQFAPRHAVERALFVVSSQATSTDFGTTPLGVSLIPHDADGRLVNRMADQPVRVCLPLPAGLSDAPNPQLAWLDGTVWHPLSSEQSNGQICADFRGFPLIGSTGGPGNTSNPDPAAAKAEGRAREARVRAARARARGWGDGYPATMVPYAFVGDLQNPSPGYPYSGIGLISGWVCRPGQVISLEVDGSRIGEVVSGTDPPYIFYPGRSSLRKECRGQDPVGFELRFNWNQLSDGPHTIRALAGETAFSTKTFTVVNPTAPPPPPQPQAAATETRTFTPSPPAPPQRQAAAAEARPSGTDGSTSPILSPTPVVGVLENPGPASSQSGIGLISGWVCTGEVIELEVDGRSIGQAASGTDRADVAAAGLCDGRADVGFGLLFNWNLLGDGSHTIRALADGVEFSRATFTVTTLGEEFVRDASGQAVVADFPSPGEQVRLVWQEGTQNFVLALDAPLPAEQAPAPAGGPLGALENPANGSFQSGISVLSGWVCEAGVVEVELNGDSAQRLAASYGTGRGDTAAVCGDSDNGFGLLLNWNLLGDGVHSVRVLADGVEFGRASFLVMTLGEEFVRGAGGQVVVADFPSVGERATLAWQESTQSFVITHFE